MGKMTKCGSCGGGRFKSTEEIQKYKVAGVTYRVSVPTEVCTKCEETYFDGPGLVRAERAVAAQVARSGRVSAETFQFMRSSMGSPPASPEDDRSRVALATLSMIRGLRVRSRSNVLIRREAR